MHTYMSINIMQYNVFMRKTNKYMLIEKNYAYMPYITRKFNS